MNKKFSISQGFTIVEMLLYMGILSVLVTVLSMVLVTLLDAQLESKSVSDVDQDGRYLMAKFAYDLHMAQSINTPATAGAQLSTMQTTMNSLNYTYSLNNGNLQIAQGGNTDILNSSENNISGLTFKRVGNGGVNDT